MAGKFGRNKYNVLFAVFGLILMVLSGGCRFKEQPLNIPVAGQSYIVSGLGLKMVYVAPGKFTMGTPINDLDSFSYETPHCVTITKGFWIGKFELLQNEYQKIMGINPSNDKGEQLPVDRVSWTDAVSFCRKLTEQEMKSGRLLSGYVYRLPTEAEWEYAARGGDKSNGYKYSGSNNVDNVAWYYENSGTSRLNESTLNYNKLKSNKSRMHKVGEKYPNELGAYDMSGNLSEWCLDWYGDFSDESVVDPKGPPLAGCRMIRGGGWMGGSRNCRVSNRDWCSPRERLISIGFRVVLAPQIQ